MGLNVALILLFGGGMIAASILIKYLEMSNQPNLAKQVEMLTYLVGLTAIISTMILLMNKVTTTFNVY